MKDDTIDLSGIIQKPLGTFTQEELDAFLDAFIEFVEARGLLFGGGAHLIDADEDLFTD